MPGFARTCFTGEEDRREKSSREKQGEKQRTQDWVISGQRLSLIKFDSIN